MTLKQRLDAIKEILEEKKAEHIESFDLTDSGYFVDGVVIATSIASKHALMLTDELKRELKPKGESFLHVDQSDEWTILDLGDIIVHLMSENYRSRYNLEQFLQEFAALIKNSRA